VGGKEGKGQPREQDGGEGRHRQRVKTQGGGERSLLTINRGLKVGKRNALSGNTAAGHSQPCGGSGGERMRIQDATRQGAQDNDDTL